MNNRNRFWTLTFVMLVLALLSIVFLNIISSRSPVRIDATATGEHELSPRTQQLLGSLPADFSILIWANFSQVDTVAKQNVVDVVTQFRRNTQRVNISTADLSTTGGLDVFRTVLTELADRDKQGIITHGQQVHAVIKSTTDFAKILDETAPNQLESLSQALTDTSARQAISSRAQAVRTASLEFIKIATSASSFLATDAANTDSASRILRDGLTAPLLQFSTFVKEISKLADTSPDPAVAARAKELVQTLGASRDALAAELDKLAKTPRPAIARVAEAIKSPRGVLVIGPANLGIVALDFDELFASTGGKADIRRQTEDLFATALISLSVPNKPIVVLTHAESQPLLTARTRLFDSLVAYLSRRGIDVVEYSAAIQPSPPTPQELDPTRTRPLVFLVLAPDSSSPSLGASDQPGAQRAQALGRALSTLSASGASICLSVNPSILPLSQQQDPVTTFALDFGLRIDSGRPVVQLKGAAGKQISDFDFVLQPLDSDHVIGRALKGLPTFLGFPVPCEPIKPTDGSDVKVTNLYSIAPAQTTWAEYEWLGFWQAAPNKRGELAPSTFDPGKDSNRGPFVIAAAVERTRPDKIVQRLVFVGSNNYFADFITQARENIDGRQVATFPGNLELLESSLLWLAHQEASIAPAPSSQAIAIIQPLTAARINILRIGLIVGIPILILALGVLYRYIRG